MNKLKFFTITILSIFMLFFGYNYLNASTADVGNWIYDSNDKYYYLDMSDIALDSDIVINIEVDNNIEYFDIENNNWISIDELGRNINKIEIVTELYDSDIILFYAYFKANDSVVAQESIGDFSSLEELRTSRVIRAENRPGEEPVFTEWVLEGNYYYYYLGGMDLQDEVYISANEYENLSFLNLENNNWQSANDDWNNIRLQTLQSSYNTTTVVIHLYYDDVFYDYGLVYDLDNHNDLKTLNIVRKDVLEEENVIDIALLPKTSSNKLAGVRFTVDNTNLTTSIFYENKVYHFNKSFSPQTDMSIFNTIEAYYMNINNTPQIIINHSDRPYLRDILEAPEGEKPAFVPHTIWDLTSNELKTQKDYRTNVYIKQADDGPIIAYMYIDEYIIDNLLTANLSWTQRQKNGFPASLFMGKYTDWEMINEVLVSDDYLEYRNLTSDWQNYVPIWNIVRGIYQLSKTYEMPRIEAVNFINTQKYYNVTKDEVETYFRDTNDKFEQFNSNPRYKLWALALQGGKDYQGTQTEIYHNPDKKDDPKNLKIIHLTYETNGHLYEAVGNDMDLIINLHPDIDGLANEKETNIVRAIVIAVIVIGWFYTLAKNKGFKNLETFIKITALYIIVAGIALFIFNNFILPDIIGTVLRLC